MYNPELALNGLLSIGGATSDNKFGGVRTRVMLVVLSHVAANGVFELQDAIAFTAADITLRVIDGTTVTYDFGPQGWVVDYLSTVLTGHGKIFYI